ncbi:MAG: hypothetical protein ACE5EI_08100 [Thermodesulfobacteriota bacterium]
MIIVKAFVVWVAFVVFSGVNGIARDLFIVPHAGRVAGDVAASVIVIAFVFTVTALFVRSTGPLSTGALLAIGALWVGLGGALEGLFLFFSGKTLKGLARDYGAVQYVFAVLIWVAVFFAPIICGLFIKNRGG